MIVGYYRKNGILFVEKIITNKELIEELKDSMTEEEWEEVKNDIGDGSNLRMPMQVFIHDEAEDGPVPPEYSIEQR